MAKYFDVVIVGAGPAGSIAALKLAKTGAKVALVERGRFPGSKNMFGGLLHNTPALNELIPGFWGKVPLERFVHKKTVVFATQTSSASLTYESDSFNERPYNGATVFRPDFDNWLAAQAKDAGAFLLCNCTAEHLVKTNGAVTGITVKGRNGELCSNLVIAADGVLSFMAKEAGLRQDIPPDNMGLGIKLLLGLPKDEIDRRFGLVRQEGADFSFLGLADDLHGGGFMYTNRESISFGLVVHLSSVIASHQKPVDVLNKAMEQSAVRKLLKGSVPLEYSAHLIPEGGIKGIPRLYSDGIILAGDAAGLCYTNGLNLEGINLAMTSGSLAADCALEALKENNFSAEKLACYEKELKKNFVIRDMKAFGKAVDMMRIDRLYQAYPALACDVLEKIYRVEGQPRKRMLSLITKEAFSSVGPRKLAQDAMAIARALL